MTRATGIAGLLRRILRRNEEAKAEVFTPLSVLEEIHAGKSRDFCLYLRPEVGEQKTDGRDLEEMMLQAFSPLAALRLDENLSLPEESFLTLADAARVMWLTPTDSETFFSRLRLLKDKGPLDRCIFLMPEQGSFGAIDWSQTWAAARAKTAEFGIELSTYTPGGWVFRVGPDGKACTFRPIVNPNPEKIARALEAICVEMQ